MHWRGFFRRAQTDAEQQQELESYIEITTDEYIARGMEPGQARLAARRKLGNLTRIREEVYQMNTATFIEGTLQDLRHAARMLRLNPAFSVTAILTLALSIGANTAIFGVIDSILIRPLAYPHAEDLVGVWHTAPAIPALGKSVNCSPSMYFTYSEENRTFQQFGLWNSSGATVTGIAEPEVARTLFVTHGVLDAIEVQPLWGRWFSRADDAPGSAETVMLTYGYWQKRFGGDKSILGRTLTIDSRPHAVIGVMPKEFRFQNDPELILPERFDRNQVYLGNFSYQGIARLKPGVTTIQANTDLGRMVPIWLSAWPPPPGYDVQLFRNAGFGPKIQPLKQEVVGDVGTALWVVMGTLGLVLLIACANIANLLLVRADARQHELAIRAALGAGWRRIAQEMLVESMTLGTLGGVMGLGLAYAGLRILVAKGPATLPRLAEIGIDPVVAAFALGASLFSGALFGVIPVWKYAGPRISTALRGVGRTFSRGRERHRASNTLVVIQVAFALVLLISSGLMIRTFQQLRSVRPGFTHPEAVLIMHSRIPDSVANDPERTMRMHNEILAKLAGLPGVASVGFADQAPLESLLGFRNFNTIYAEDKKFTEGPIPTARIRKIAPGFFRMMGTRIVAGRDFNWSDLYGKRHVAMVSENLAREWWGDPRAALGKRIRENPQFPWLEIVGVVENVYDDGMQVKAPAAAYWPAMMDRYWDSENGFAVRTGMYAIRSSQAVTERLAAEVRQVIWSVNGKQPVFLVNTLKTLYDLSMERTSFTLVMLALASGMALLLGIVGIYGVISYAVSQRTREIGIRTALGAQPAGLLRMFVSDGLKLAAIGAALGLAAAAGLTRLMSSLLFGITALDPVTYAAVSVLLIFAAVLASYLPARRAASVDPIEVLKAE